MDTDRNRSGIISRLQKRYNRVLWPAIWFQTKETEERLEGDREETPRETKNGPKTQLKQYSKVQVIPHTKMLQQWEDQMGF